MTKTEFDGYMKIWHAGNAAGVQSAPLFDCRGRWVGYEIYHYPPGRRWGAGGYLDTREGRDWLPGEIEKGIR